MRTKKIFCLIIILIITIESFSPLAFSESNEITAKEFSESLEMFSQENIKYAFSEAIPNEGKISLENVQLNRLVVSTNTNNQLENYCGAVDVLEGFNNWHLLQFKSAESAQIAYEYYSQQDYVNYV